MELHILLTVILISFACLGFNLSSHEGYLLDKFAEYFRDKYDEKGNNIIYHFGKTLINCPRCMASFWTLFFSPLILQYFISIPKELLIADYIIASIGAVAFLNSVLINLYEKTE